MDISVSVEFVFVARTPGLS